MIHICGKSRNGGGKGRGTWDGGRYRSLSSGIMTHLNQTHAGHYVRDAMGGNGSLRNEHM